MNLLKLPRNLMFTMAASALALLTACGSGGRVDEPLIPDDLPVVVGGTVNWWDVQTTPDGGMGVVNGTGNAIVHVVFTDDKGDDHFYPNIAPGAVWSSTEHPLPRVYLVSAYGADGRVFQRYGAYRPDIGWEAFVISNANWNTDL